MSNQVVVPDSARNMGIHCVGGKGSGKSRLMARAIAYRDFLANVPLVIVDPQGGAIDNFLDKLMYRPIAEQQQLSKRLLYVDMSGRSGYVAGFPLYYQHPGDSMRDVATRFLDLIHKLDPKLSNAPVHGFNAVSTLGTYAGMIMVALGMQANGIPSLLRDPDAWHDRLVQLQEGEVGEAARFFLTDYPKLERGKKDLFNTKLMPFLTDQKLKVMFCSPTPTIDWNAVVKDKRAVLLDLSQDDERDVPFKMMWVLRSLMEYVKHRESNRDAPVSVIYDELAFLLTVGGAKNEFLAPEFDELLNKVARYHNVWVTLGHQEMYQIPDNMQGMLMSMGTQILGVTIDEPTAMLYAKRWSHYDPYKVKKEIPRYDRGIVRDYQTVEFSPAEQLIEASRMFRTLKRFEFLASVCVEEGTVSNELVPFDIKQLDVDRSVYPPRPLFPNEAEIKQTKRALARRDGLPVEETAEEIDRLLKEKLPAEFIPLDTMVKKRTSLRGAASRGS